MEYKTAPREISLIEQFMEEAVKEAIQSPCEKSKRGVVIVNNHSHRVIGRGYNRPPEGFDCVSDYCRGICSSYAIHAEENAIFDALRNSYKLENSTLFHIKVIDEKPVSSGGPSCVNCSKIILDNGIRGVVLKHEEGYGYYESREFHELSLESLKKSNPGK